ncbi:MAG: hypothetical protein CM1200mP22_33240 [Dehalococcoidia bacterium]|nr:MAG: hypothetical protein CM1200mP22_33240 [Dehalococcoidia bacterium]
MKKVSRATLRTPTGTIWGNSGIFSKITQPAFPNGNGNIDLNGGPNESISRNPIWAEVDIDVLNKYIENLRIHKGYRDTTTGPKKRIH